MSTENSGPLSISLDTSNVKTAIPIIADGVYAKLRLAKIEQNQHEKGPIIKFISDLVDPVPNTDGGTITPGSPGSKIFDSVTLFDKNTPPGEVPEWALKKISQRIDALLGTGDPGNAKGKPSRPAFDAQLVPALIGKEFIAKIKAKTGEYAGNEIADVKFPGDMTV